MPLTFLQIIDAFLACYFLLVAAFFSAKQFAFAARDGDARTHHGPVFSAQWIGRSAFDIFRAAILLVCVLRLFVPSIDALIAPLPVMWDNAALRGLGAALMLVGLWRSLYAHSYLGEAWRSGVDSGAGEPLVTGGPYGRCRNPIFSAVITAQLGFALALPSVFTAICLVAGVVALIVQAEVEEKHLSARFGADYDAYRGRTRRWTV